MRRNKYIIIILVLVIIIFERMHCMVQLELINSNYFCYWILLVQGCKTQWQLKSHYNIVFTVFQKPVKHWSFARIIFPASQLRRFCVRQSVLFPWIEVLEHFVTFFFEGFEYVSEAFRCKLGLKIFSGIKKLCCKGWRGVRRSQ